MRAIWAKDGSQTRWISDDEFQSREVDTDRNPSINLNINTKTIQKINSIKPKTDHL
jgi:hypothetical protein